MSQSQPAKKPQAKSDVWKFFTKEGPLSARCTICTKILKHAGNTTNLWNHHKSLHDIHAQTSSSTGPMPPKRRKKTCEDELHESDPDNPSDAENSGPRQKEMPVTPLTTSKSKTQPQATLKNQKINDSFGRMNSFKDGGSSANKITNAIICMVASENLPLSIVDSNGFKNLMKATAPLYTVPSRRTITRLLDAKYDLLKSVFMNQLRTSPSYSLTCDIWTDSSNQSYLGVTIHYLHNELRLKNGTIGVFPLNENHTASYIRETFESITRSFEIESSDSTAIITDNAANMVKAITDGFGSAKRLPCIAHALSHLVPDALKVNSRVKGVIGKVRSIVTVTRRSVVASNELKRLQIRDGKTDSTALKFKQDVPTRWNSTYYMIDRFLALKDYVYQVLRTCPTAPEMILREEIDLLEDVIRLLGPIEYVITEISGDTYPTSSLAIPIIRCMEKAIRACVPITEEGLKFKLNVLTAIETRFAGVESFKVLAVSTILDPRFKCIHFQSRSAATTATLFINTSLKEVTKIRDEESTNTNIVQTLKDKEFDVWSHHDKLVVSSSNALSRDESDAMSPELRQYIHQQVLPRTENPFVQWQTLKHAYPTLFTLAMRYLPVVATSVPSERLFSKAGIIKSDLRSRISGTRLNKLLFLGSLTQEDWAFE